MIDRAVVEHAPFNLPELGRLLASPNHLIAQWSRLYDQRRTTASRGIDLFAVLGTAVIGEGAKAGLPAEKIAAHATPLVNEALLYLGMETLPWKVRGTPDEQLRFSTWLDQGDGFPKVRRVQELLKIHERRASRFLIFKAGQDPVAMNREAPKNRWRVAA